MSTWDRQTILGSSKSLLPFGMTFGFSKILGSSNSSDTDCCHTSPFSSTFCSPPRVQTIINKLHSITHFLGFSTLVAFALLSLSICKSRRNAICPLIRRHCIKHWAFLCNIACSRLMPKILRIVSGGWKNWDQLKIVMKIQNTVYKQFDN